MRGTRTAFVRTDVRKVSRDVDCTSRRGVRTNGSTNDALRTSMSVRDDRLPPFAWLDLQALDRIRAEAPSAHVASVRNVYAALTESASRARDPQQQHFRTTRAQLAHIAGVSVKTIDRACAILIDIGILAVEARTDEDGRTLPSIYRLLRGGDTMSPPGATGEDTMSPPITRPRNIERTKEGPSDHTSGNPAVKFNGKRVPDEVAAQAMKAVETWASKTDQTLRGFTRTGKQTDSLTRVVGAMLDYPEVLELWPTMIDRALERPWWSEPDPGVGVVFGPTVVEKSINHARRPAGLMLATQNVRPFRTRGDQPSSSEILALRGTLG
jgi:hypothetical protein